LYSVTQGATTIWERWDAWTHDKGFQNPGMNSFNHYAYGAIGAWMYAVVGGIDLDPDEPGYKHILMRPQPGGGLTSARAELKTGFGLIRSAWRLEDEQFAWQISVPPNTRATISIPAPSSASIHEQGKPVEEIPEITLIRREADIAVYRVASGDYFFTSER
jgi:alpha-L-rhamnosidase